MFGHLRLSLFIEGLKGTPKIHLVLDHNSFLPCFFVISEGKTAAIKLAKGLKISRK
jgi:hypothetical protein